ncbi:MAG: hypothetical protein JWN98_2138, partial [Abditibacteriota bacterium]|nr:hypothetical protein [Abditibacteriota bacterium]
NIKSDYSRLQSTIEVGLAAAKTKPELAAQLVAAGKAIPLGQAPLSFQGRALLAALEARIGRSTVAANLADQVVEVALAYGKNGMGNELGTVASLLAKGSASLALRALKQVVVEPKQEYQRISAYTRVINELVKHDLPGAQQVMEELGKLGNEQAEWGFSQAALPIIKALGKTDWKAALVLARRVDENYRAQVLLTVAPFAPKDEILPLLREAVSVGPNHPLNSNTALLSAARIAAGIDAAASREMLERVHNNLESLMNGDAMSLNWRTQTGTQMIAAYAVALSHSDPLQSRLLIEEEWAFAGSQTSEQYGPNRQSVLAIAMSAIDPERALELSWQIESRNPHAVTTDLSPQFDAQRQIARFLLMPSRPLNEVLEGF